MRWFMLYNTFIDHNLFYIITKPQHKCYLAIQAQKNTNRPSVRGIL